MHVYRGASPHGLYRAQLVDLVEKGADVKVRGQWSKELLDVATVIEEPRRRVHIVPGRNANPFLALSEALHILAGRNDTASLFPYNKRILEFSDDGEHLYGAYGPRIASQIMQVVKRLRTNPNDRRAVLSIWKPEDLVVETRDPPCNDMVIFKLRDGRLHMTVFNRSNDLHWGLYAVNLCQFSILQEYIAVRLQVDLGQQTHLSNSLHIYTEGPGAKITERMLTRETERMPNIPDPNPLFPLGLPMHEVFVADCNAVLEGCVYGGDAPESEGVAFLEFASDFLRCYRNWNKGIWVSPCQCRHAEYYSDWVFAGKEFQKWRERNS